MSSQSKRPAAKPGTTQTNNSIVAKINSTGTHNQRLAILKQLRAGPTITLQFRNMGIAVPTPRFFELRALGHSISTTLVTVVDSAGVEHADTTRYELLSEKEITDEKAS